MKLKLISVESTGDLERERIVMEAREGLDVGDFAVFRCTRGKNGSPVSGNIERAYWFPNIKITSGDLIVLYTKRGVRSKKEADEKIKVNSHFFYWGYAEPIWFGNYLPVVIHTPSWDYIRPAAPFPEEKKL